MVTEAERIFQSMLRRHVHDMRARSCSHPLSTQSITEITGLPSTIFPSRFRNSLNAARHSRFDEVVELQIDTGIQDSLLLSGNRMFGTFNPGWPQLGLSLDRREEIQVCFNFG
nr:hypothetical protein WG70_12200 [Burkholderia oklahomensis EO147]